MPARFIGVLCLLVACIFPYLAAAPAGALTFNLVYVAPGTSVNGSVATSHPRDPDGSQLTALVQQATADWADIIEDNHVMEIQYYYAGEDLTGSALANAQTVNSTSSFGPGGTNNRTTVGRLQVSDEGNFWFDPTPNDDSEFTLVQTLLDDLSASSRSSDFVEGADPSDALEIGYRGMGNIANPIDMLSTLRHEVGHLMGITNQLPYGQTVSADSLWELPTSLLGGRSVAVANTISAGSHFASPYPLMRASTSSQTRFAITAADALAVANVGGFTQIDLPRKGFMPALGGNTLFSDPNNWIGGRAPDSSDSAFIQHGGTVSVISAAASESLTIERNSTATVINVPLTVGGELTVGTPGLTPGTGNLNIVGSAEVTANDVALYGGQVSLGGGTLRSPSGSISNGALILGNGQVSVAGTLWNNGTLRASGGTLTITGPAIANPTADLDGDSLLGTVQGIVEAVAGNIQVTINNAPTYRGTMTIGAGHYIDLPAAWELSTNGAQLTLDGSGTQAAELRGGDLTVKGTVTVDQQATMTMDVTVSGNSALVELPDANDQLTINEKLTLVNSGRINGNGRVVVGDDFLNNGGRAFVDTLELHNDVMLQSGVVQVANIESASSPVVQAGGTLEFAKLNGSLVHNAGTWIVGKSLVTGDAETAKDGHVEFTITDGSTYSQLQVDGTAVMAGELAVEIDGGYIPSGGETFEIVTAGSLTVSNLNLVGPDAYRFQPIWNSNQLLLEALPPLYGDYNDDGLVDLGDYTVWRDHFGAPAATLPNDADGGTIGMAQYATWKNNFQPAAAAQSYASPVPEPLSHTLLIAGLILSAAVRRRAY